MDNVDVIVDFEKHCKTCKYKDLEEKYDPCNDCLDNPVNTNSSKPVYYKEDEELVEKENKK